ncbi:MAG TPA: PHP domain-containing protein [Chloroflexota bacterium]|jgi:predicted metal-dependent phosphoesterase TrpH|nr:PHP domain-containing protein [Chloroflexota bacterium]
MTNRNGTRPRASVVDLHTHTTVSDGRLRPEELVRHAHAGGVRCLAVTDHDTTDGLAAARAEAARLGIELIPGIELSTELHGQSVHILGYFLRYEEPAFQAWLLPMRDDRLSRAQRMVARLAELGYPVAWERVLAIAGDGSVGRPHIAQALLEAGHVGSITEAFDRFLADGGPAYVERMKLSPQEAIAQIHRYGGVAAVAHPCDFADVERVVAELAAAGLDGIETYYQGYEPARIEFLLALARHYHLIPTGGSDYHGFPMGDAPTVTNDPGTVYVPPEAVERLRDRAARYRVRV